MEHNRSHERENPKDSPEQRDAPSGAKALRSEFLHDKPVIAGLLTRLTLSLTSICLRLAGQGAITDLLAQAGGPLDCVELDRDLADFLEKGLPGMATSPSISKTFSSSTWLP